MSQNQQKPNKRIWLMAGVVTLLLIVGGVTVSAFLSSHEDSIPAQKKQDDDDDKDDKKTASKTIARKKIKIRLFAKMPAKFELGTLFI